MTLQEKYAGLEKQNTLKEQTILTLRTAVTEAENKIRANEVHQEELILRVKTVQADYDLLASKSTADSAAAVELQESYNLLLRKQDELQTSMRLLEEQRDQWQRKEALHLSERASLQDQIREITAELEKSRTASAEYTNLHTQFQEYKKRAQLALKQVRGLVLPIGVAVIVADLG